MERAAELLLGGVAAPEWAAPRGPVPDLEPLGWNPAGPGSDEPASSGVPTRRKSDG